MNLKFTLQQVKFIIDLLKNGFKVREIKALFESTFAHSTHHKISESTIYRISYAHQIPRSNGEYASCEVQPDYETSFEKRSASCKVQPDYETSFEKRSASCKLQPDYETSFKMRSASCKLQPDYETSFQMNVVDLSRRIQKLDLQREVSETFL